MHLFFIVITFIVIISIIFLAESFMVAMLVVSLIANFLVICLNSTKLASKLQSLNREQPAEKPSEVLETNDELPDILNPYGKDYDQHQQYIESYSSCYKDAVPAVAVSYSEDSKEIDSMNALLSQQRSRDKRGMDGAVSKDSDFYKYYFANELSEYEAKPWWGVLESKVYDDEQYKK